MKRILLPVDFSVQTRTICRYAIEFARHAPAEIRLFHTFFDQILVSDAGFPDTLDMRTVYHEGLVHEVRRQAIRNMHDLEDRLAGSLREEGLTEVTLSNTLTGGEPEEELKQVCREFHPDLVVMGMTGKGNNLKVWGKFSSFIIDHAKVPVITIPGEGDFRPFAEIMFAADLAGNNDRVIASLANLFASFGSRIHVVHFTGPEREQEAEQKMAELQSAFRQAPEPGRILFETVRVTDDNQSAIDRFVSDRRIDLIAFVPHRRNLLYMLFTRNITKKNFFAVNLPLIAVNN